MTDTEGTQPDPPKDFTIVWKDGDMSPTTYSRVLGSAVEDQGFMVLYLDDMIVVINRAETLCIEVADSEF